MIPSLARRLILNACFLAAAPSLAQAQAIGAQGDDFLHRVVKGDILLDLAERYTQSPELWTFLQSYNAVDDPRRLPIGKVLRIPFRLIPERPSTAQVMHVTGSAQADDQPLRPGGQVEEGSVLRTAPGSYITLQLEDGSTLTLPGNSHIQMERLRAFQGTGLIDTQMSIKSGAIESIVAPQNTGIGRFEVKTPVTITGVRGTRLRVRSGEHGSQTEILDGQAQVQGSSSQATELRAGQGAATSPDGQLHGVQSLPPAPQLSVPVRTAKGWQVEFPPVPNAHAYLVRVTSDAEGMRPWHAKTITSPSDIQFSAPGAGTYYVLVRAITESGLMGPDAAQPFEGRAVLLSSSGRAVATGYGGQVYLTDY